MAMSFMQKLPGNRFAQAQVMSIPKVMHAANSLAPGGGIPVGTGKRSYCRVDELIDRLNDSSINRVADDLFLIWS
jgi:hypothetical protein